MKASKSVFPRTIKNMIRRGWVRGDRAVELTQRINTSRTARKLEVRYSTQQIAAGPAWITMQG